MATPASLKALLTGIVDYAGLFPPAGLHMQAAVDNYARYRDERHSWMLGRFVLPMVRADEFLGAAARYIKSAGEPWRLSAVVGDDIEGDFARIAAFNQTNDGALIDSAEGRAASREGIERIARALPGGVRAFVELPVDGDPTSLVKAIADSRESKRLRAKVRTGGVTADAIPSVDRVARFVRACYASNVPFKATAGLHHALRGERALTYEAGGARAVMHGFLNVFLAAVFCFNGLGAADAPQLLALESAESLRFDDDGVTWGEYRLSTAEIATIRKRFAMSFGSCSFAEPVAGLVALGLME